MLGRLTGFESMLVELEYQMANRKRRKEGENPSRHYEYDFFPKSLYTGVANPKPPETAMICPVV